METITIIYNSNPNVSEEYSHNRGSLSSFTSESSKSFDDWESALAFWQECYFPITELKEIPMPIEINAELSEVFNEIISEDEAIILTNKLDFISQEDEY